MPDTIQSIHANQMLVQVDAGDVYLLFFELRPPVLVAATEEERRAALRSEPTIRAQGVARMVIPLSRLGSFVAALSQIAKGAGLVSEEEEQHHAR